MNTVGNEKKPRIQPMENFTVQAHGLPLRTEEWPAHKMKQKIEKMIHAKSTNLRLLFLAF